jgi:hypothetical protein
VLNARAAEKFAPTTSILAEKEHLGGRQGRCAAGRSLSCNDESPEDDFDGNDVRILSIDGSSKCKENTIANILYNVSQYATTPSASTTKINKIADKISMKATLACRLTKT